MSGPNEWRDELNEEDLLFIEGEETGQEERVLPGAVAVPEQVGLMEVIDNRRIAMDEEIKKSIDVVITSVEKMRVFHESIISTNVRIGEGRDMAMSLFVSERTEVGNQLKNILHMWNEVKDLLYTSSRLGLKNKEDVLRIVSIVQSCSETLGNTPFDNIINELTGSEARKEEIYQILSGVAVYLGLTSVDDGVEIKVKELVNDRDRLENENEELRKKLSEANVFQSKNEDNASVKEVKGRVTEVKRKTMDAGETFHDSLQSVASKIGEKSLNRENFENGNMKHSVQVAPRNCEARPAKPSLQRKGNSPTRFEGSLKSEISSLYGAENWSEDGRGVSRSTSPSSSQKFEQNRNEIDFMKIMLRTNALGPLKKFSGDNKDVSFDEFLSGFELRYPVDMLSDDDLLPLLVESLKGKAREYYDSIPREERNGYMNVKILLKHRLEGDSKMRNVESLNLLQNLTFDRNRNSIREFILDFEKLAEKAYSTLEPSNRQLFMAQTFSRILMCANWGPVYQIQQVLEETVNDKYNRIKDICLRHDRISESKKTALGGIHKSSTYKEKFHNTNGSNRPSERKSVQMSKPNEDSNSQVKCFTCGKIGHMSKTCWKKTGKGNGQNGYNGGVNGSSRSTSVSNASNPPRLTGGNAIPQSGARGWTHREPIVRSSMRVQDVSSETDANVEFFKLLTADDQAVARCQSIRSESDYRSKESKCDIVGSRPIVKVSIFNCEVDGLIDTGAQITTISKKFLVDLYLKGVKQGDSCTVLSRDQEYKVVDASGNEVKYTLIIKVPIAMLPDVYPKEVVMYVVDYAPDEPILLGTNSLGLLGIEISRRLSDGSKVAVPGFCGEPLVKLDSVVNKKLVESARVMSVRVHARMVITSQAVKQLEVQADDETLSDTSAMFWSDDESTLESGMLRFDDKCIARIAVHNVSKESMKFDRGRTVGVTDTGVRVASLGEEESYDMLDYCKNRVELTNDERVRKLLKVIQDKSNTEMPEELTKLIVEFSDVFALDDCELKQTNVVTHDIDTGDNKPVRQKPRPVPMGAKAKFREIIDGLLDRGIIENSSSPWASPIVLVQKKDGTLRLCIDYREVNKRIKLDCFPLPRIDDLIQSLAGKKWFTTLDLHSGFWQVGLSEQAKEKSAFTTTEGLFQFKVLPFGLATSPAVFQRMMSTVLSEFDEDKHEVQCYIDDVLIATDTLQRHMVLLRKVFMSMRSANLSLKPSKCSFLKSEVKYLGHVLKGDGVHADPEKVTAIREYPRPTNVSELRSFLGLCSYYRKFVLKFGAMAKPLNELTSKGIPWIWDERREKAFSELRDTLCSAPVLIQPDFEGAQCGSNPFILFTDACKFGVGAVLCQRGKDEFLHPIYFVSRSLKKAESNYSITDIEALAVIHAIQRLRSYLYDMVVIVRTDHQPLTTFFKVNNSGRVARWALMIQSYNKLTIEYVKGKTNVVADALSRGTQVREEGDCAPTGGGNQEMVMVAKCHVEQTEEQVEDHGSWLQQLRLEGTFQKLIQRLENGDSDDVVKLPRMKCKLSLKDFVLSEDNLFFVSQEGIRMKVVPERLRKSLYDGVHSGQMGGHFATKKMINLLKKHYFWNGLPADVVRWHAECKECFLTNCRTINMPPLKPILVGRPYEIVGVDLMDMGVSSSGNRYILMLVDHFSKWLGAFPIPNKNAEVVAEMIVTRWICEGARWPKQFLSDQGSEFLNQVVDQIKILTDIGWITTKGYNPRENGLVERANGTIKNILKKKVKLISDWDKILPFAVYSYNTSVHESTGESPYFLLHGMDPILVSNVDEPEYNQWYVHNADEYKTTLMEGVRVAHLCAKENAEKESLRVKEYYDRVHKVNEGWYPVIGERVYMRIKNQQKRGSNPKLLCGFSGPYRVLNVTDNSAMIVDIGGKGEPIQIPFDSLVHVPDSLDDGKVGPEVQRGKRGRKKVVIAKRIVHNVSIFREAKAKTLRDTMYEKISCNSGSLSLEDLVSLDHKDALHPLYNCSGAILHTLLATVSPEKPCSLVSSSLGEMCPKRFPADLLDFVPKNVIMLSHAISWIAEFEKGRCTLEHAIRRIRLPNESLVSVDSLAEAYVVGGARCDHVCQALETQGKTGLALDIHKWGLSQVDFEQAVAKAKEIWKERGELPEVKMTFWPRSFETVLSLSKASVDFERGGSMLYGGEKELVTRLSDLLTKNTERKVKILIAVGGRESPIALESLVDNLPKREKKVKIMFFPLPAGIGNLPAHMEKLRVDWDAGVSRAAVKGFAVSKAFLDVVPSFTPVNVLGAKPLQGDALTDGQLSMYCQSVRVLIDKEVGKYRKS